MEHRKILSVQSLVANPDFRKMVLNSKHNGRLVNQLNSEFQGYDLNDLEAASQIVLSLEKNARLDGGANKAKIWSDIIKSADQFDRETQNAQGTLKVVKKPVTWKIYLKYAAVFAGILMVVSWSIFSNLSEQPVQQQNLAVVKSNPSGQKSRIQLSDGSVVHLNAESELQYVEGFSENERKIYLKGEAYFEVAKDANRPFTVVSNNISVTALGTEFNVNAFSNNIEVALLEGSIMINDLNGSDEVKLEPMQVVRFDSKSGKLNMIDVNAADLALWRNRVIYFDNTPIDDAVKILSRWYAVDIDIINASSKELTFSGKFSNRSLELLLKNLSYTLDFKYTIDKNRVILDFNK
ncbi:FecR domain-containing protein [Reichenbachiella sp. MALMAid0571]|uniref:FecR family protein n=1 Tax=Reichenbachiella sp. MALMAid0571 TaxID=3143939 RepID=UPI0032DF8BB8